jgi:hypothetical protein
MKLNTGAQNGKMNFGDLIRYLTYVDRQKIFGGAAAFVQCTIVHVYLGKPFPWFYPVLKRPWLAAERCWWGGGGGSMH